MDEAARKRMQELEKERLEGWEDEGITGLGVGSEPVVSNAGLDYPELQDELYARAGYLTG